MRVLLLVCVCVLTATMLSAGLVVSVCVLLTATMSAGLVVSVFVCVANNDHA